MAFDPNTVRRDYGDAQDEAKACRSDCALFDFSFVGRVRLDGPGALDAIGRLTARPLADLLPGEIRYAVREHPDGRLLSDLTVWRCGETRYEVMSGRGEDIADLVSERCTACRVENLSARTALFAVQGPGSLRALVDVTDLAMLSQLRYFGFISTSLRGIHCLIGRLGYTGEPGFELLLPRVAAGEIWATLAQRARPAGFAAADILRIEAGLVLFANEFRVPVTAREAGLERFAGSFRAPRQPEITLVCFRASAHEKLVLWQPSEPVARPTDAGMVTITSACHSVQAGGALGLGFALRSDVTSSAPLHDPSGQFKDIELVSMPYFDPHKSRPRASWHKAIPDGKAGAFS